MITRKYLIASRSYYHDCLTWCVQRHQQIPRWQSVFYLCTDTTVYIVFLVAGEYSELFFIRKIRFSVIDINRNSETFDLNEVIQKFGHRQRKTGLCR